MNPEDVQLWDEWRQKLNHTQKHKAKKFIENDCIKYNGNGVFLCEPIEGYNKTTHVMVPDKTYKWRCTCQGWFSKEQQFKSGMNPNLPFCSHLYSLMLCFKRRKFGRGGVETT